MRKPCLFFLLLCGALAWGQDAKQSEPAKGPVERPQAEQPQTRPDVPEKDPNILEAVTFASAKGAVYLDLHEVAGAFGKQLSYDSETHRTTMDEVEIDRSKLRQLWDESSLISLEDLAKYGIVVTKNEDGTFDLSDGQETKKVVVPAKSVEISVSRQTLRAWQGDRLVIKSHISSGRSGHDSPLGNFKTGPVKKTIIYSSLYENAPMPFAVQVIGDVFVHGYGSVPKNPASHGCIRMPLSPRNAAEYFYNWIDLGVSVKILKDWTDDAKAKILLEPGGQEELSEPGYVKNIRSGSPYGDHTPKAPKKPAAPPKFYGPPIGGGKSGGH